MGEETWKQFMSTGRVTDYLAYKMIEHMADSEQKARGVAKHGAMKQTVGELLDAQQLTALVELHDRGALDWIIRARLETALARAQEADR